MVDAYGQWIEEKDYSTYPKEKWCDMDYMANWIISTGYKVLTTMGNLIENVLNFYMDQGLEQHSDGYYYAIKDTRDSPENLMVHLEDVKEFVRDNGGLKEFDWIY